MVRACSVPTLALVLSMVTGARPRIAADASLTLRTPPLNDPGDPIVVYLDLTSDRGKVAAVGSRLIYDQGRVSLVALEKGAAVPSSWGFVFEQTMVPGEVDAVLTDQTEAAAIMDPATGGEVVKLTFLRSGGDCDPVTFGFNSAVPDPGPPAAAFPLNHYVVYSGTTITIEAASTVSLVGPVAADHGFVRGNINDRAAHGVDIQDVVDLVATLFQGFVLGFDCEAAADVNNDGETNVADVVTLIEGIFHRPGQAIAPPVGEPGVAAIDGGSVPSVLGCADGERCL